MRTPPKVKIEDENGNINTFNNRSIYEAIARMIEELEAIGAIPDKRHIKRIIIEPQEQGDKETP
jgi:hypothetical protein